MGGIFPRRMIKCIHICTISYRIREGLRLIKVRKISVTNLLILGVVVLFLISDVIIGLVTYKKCETMLIDQIKQRSESLAKCVTPQLDGKIHVAVTETDV